MWFLTDKKSDVTRKEKMAAPRFNVFVGSETGLLKGEETRETLVLIVSGPGECSLVFKNTSLERRVLSVLKSELSWHCVTLNYRPLWLNFRNTFFLFERQLDN